jgi:hypothetical protein
MKVALDAGDTLDVALLDGDRVIGTLSLQIKGLSGSTPKVVTRAASTASENSGSSTSASRKRKQRKPLSEEAKARMAAAQKARWDRRRAEQGGTE